jgi:flagellar M-ring protein FliF
MDVRGQMGQLAASLASLGPRRLTILGLAGLLVVMAVSVAGYMLTRPQYEVLYTGLSARDVSAIGAVLGEARIDFDVSEDGQTVKVAYGQAARARMLLAEKGLPQSARAGYELFDNIGALGLTSFMQDVTLIRALEGELARTIQSINGVRAARVHIVLPKRNSFRRDSGKASASVLIRTDGSFDPRSANAIRHLVAGAVPGLAVERVSVLDTDGTLLASGEDALTAAPRRLLDLENQLGGLIRQNVHSTLMPYLGAGNFQVSVAARLNTDRRRIDETTYDPNSRVERSVRDIKEKTSAVNASSAAATSVQQEIPEEQTGGGPGQKNSEKRERKERLTNYEISSRRVLTETDGYDVERISIAVIVNRKALQTVLGRELTAEDLAAQEKEIRGLVASAAGLDLKRGDTVKVTIVDFIQSTRPLEPVAGPGMGEYLMRFLPVLVNVAAVLGVVLLLVFLAIRPALRLLSEQPASAMTEAEAHVQDRAGELADGTATTGEGAELPAPPAHGELPPAAETAALQPPAGEPAATDVGDAAATDTKAQPEPERDPLAGIIEGDLARRPLEQLQKLIEYDDRQAAAVLREWLREGEVT